MIISPESLVEYPKTDTPYLVSPDNLSDYAPIREGVVLLPEYLGGGNLHIEGFDKTFLQDRALRFAILGNGRTAKLQTEIELSNNSGNRDLDLQKSLRDVVTRYPETTIFDLITVLRGLEPIVDRLRPDNQEGEPAQLTSEQLEFIERFRVLEKIVEDNLDFRFKRTRDEELTFNRTGGKTPKIFEHHVVNWSEQRERDKITREYDQKLARIKDQRSEAALKVRLEELYNVHQRNPDKLMLIELLRGNLPLIISHKSAIHAMNALVLRADYLPDGSDLAADFIQLVRNAASLVLSHSVLTSENPLGRGAYKDALLERQLRPLQRARHTTGNPPGNTPDRRKMTPIVPID